MGGLRGSAVRVGAADDEDEGLGTVAVSGRVVVCPGCFEAEGVIECDCCGEHLCPDCWGEGTDRFCETCLVEGPGSRPIERVEVGDRYL